MLTNLLLVMNLEEQNIIGKIAADKDSKKLGRIIKTEDVEEKRNRAPINYALILVSKPLRKDIVILVETSKIIKQEAEYVWFDILKKDFDQEVRETRALVNL